MPNIDQKLNANLDRQGKLLEFFEEKAGEIDASVTAALKAVPELSKTFYVSENGNDNNDGSNDKPLATIAEAVRRANTSSFLRINLLSDITMSDLRTDQKVIYLHGFGAQRKITSPVYLSNLDNTRRSSGFEIFGGTLEVILRNIDIVMTDQNPELATSDSAYRSFLKSLHNDTSTRLGLSINNGSVSVADGCSLVGSVYFVPKVLRTRSLTFDSADMPGKWVSGIAAGTPRSDVDNEIQTNLDTL